MEIFVMLAALTYTEGRAEAARTGKPLVVFVGCKSRVIPGAVSCEHRYFDGYPAQCIIVATPTLKWHETLPMAATDALLAVSVQTALPQASAQVKTVSSYNRGRVLIAQPIPKRQKSADC